MPYSKERREAVLKKMLPPNNKTIVELSREEGIAEPTLYLWRKKARSEGRLMPKGYSTPEGWKSIDMFSAVVETSSLNEQELAQYCRKKGVFPEQIQRWREACENANDWDRAQAQATMEQIKGYKKKTLNLERELQRKEKALAEAAALLILKKKARSLLEEDEDE